MPETSGPPLSATVSVEPGATVVALAGELDLATAGRLRRRLAEVLETRPARLVLDASGLTFLDASGASVLVEAQRSLAAAGGAVVLRHPTRPVRTVVRLLDLQGVLPEED